MRLLLLAGVSLTACCAAGFDYRTQAGVVTASPNEVCMQIGNSALRPGARVAVVWMGVPQSVLRAEVVRKRDKPCSDVDDGESYQLRPLGGEPGMLAQGIALVGFDGRLEVRAGVAAADLDGDGRKESFRSCAGNEGVHFTIWSGSPLKGTRRFHAYHYAGYDLEPNCTARDYEPAPEH